MNLGEIKTVLRRVAGLSTTDPLNDWVNAAMRDFETAHKWTFLETEASVNTTVGDSTPTMPADLFKIISAKIVGDALPLTYIPRNAWNTRIPDDTVSGKPEFFTVVGLSGMQLYKVPDAIYPIKLVYRKTLTTLVNDVDTPGIPTKYHYAIVEKASAIGLQAESEEERAVAAEDRYQTIVENAIVDSSEHQEAEFAQVQDTQLYGTYY